ncbi:MAG: hypothetical protein ACOCYW_05495, partial [Roseicyclus sp.]
PSSGGSGTGPRPCVRVSSGGLSYCVPTGPGGTSVSGDGPDDPSQASGCPIGLSCGFSGVFTLPGMEIGSLTFTITSREFFEDRGLLKDVEVELFAARLSDETNAFIEAAIFDAPEVDPAVIPLPPAVLMLGSGLLGLGLLARRRRAA